jgi:two-component system, LuxR family, sensor kinase FixL
MPYKSIVNNSDVLETIQHGVIITDVRGGIVYWNLANQQIFGYSADEIIGKHLQVLYGDEENMPFKEIMHRCIEGDAVQGKWHGLKNNGEKVWLDIRAKILKKSDQSTIGCVITVSEIEKLVQAEELLNKNKALSEAIYNASDNAIITIDENGYILSCNRGTEKLFGYGKEELIGRSINILMPFPYSEDHNGFIKNYLLSGVKKVIGKSREIQGRTKKGKIFPIELTVSEVEWKGNRLFTGIIRDLTFRRQMERKILETGQEERRKIGRDLHDGLGQMLTGIRMLSENLARKLRVNGLPAADEVEEIAELIREADEFARTLSRGLVQVDLESKGLSVALQNLCNRTEKLTGVHCFYFDLENTDVKNHNMALHLYRIGQEAISNAVRHGKPDEIKVRLSSNEYHTSLTVMDDGDGFSNEPNPRLGTGIEIMKHRAGIMGGVLEIARTLDNLTQVRCIVPNNLNHFEEQKQNSGYRTET